MSTFNTTTISATGEKYGRAFWERLWRTAGIQSVGLFIIAWMLYEYQPQTTAFVSLFGGLAVLNLMWFAAAIRTTLADAGQDGWGAAATSSSAVVGGFLLLLISVSAATAGSEDPAFASGLKGLGWSFFVLSSFPRAMLIMSGSFGLWRAKLISNAVFAVFVTAVVLVLLGGTTWLSGGVWAPEGLYSRLVSPIIGLVWVVAVSRIVLRSPASRTAW